MSLFVPPVSATITLNLGVAKVLGRLRALTCRWPAARKPALDPGLESQSGRRATASRQNTFVGWLAQVDLPKNQSTENNYPEKRWF
jgi:hypothetical protein